MNKERLIYTIESGDYCGHTVNLPFVIQSESYEDLKKNATEMLRVYIEELQKMLDSGDPFEMVEFYRPKVDQDDAIWNELAAYIQGLSNFKLYEDRLKYLKNTYIIYKIASNG